MCLADMLMSEINVARPSIIAFARTNPEVSESTPAPDRLLAGAPKHVARNFFTDPSGQLFAGVWESSPGKWRVKYTETEFCHITRGSVCIEDEAGAALTFRAGDSFVVPSGFSGTWQVLEPTAKLYVIFESASK
jgi:uncharacterized cupin superfamily protein